MANHKSMLCTAKPIAVPAIALIASATLIAAAAEVRAGTAFILLVTSLESTGVGEYVYEIIYGR